MPTVNQIETHPFHQQVETQKFLFDVFGFELEDDEMKAIRSLDTATSLFFDHRDPAMVKFLSEAKRNT